MPFVVALSSLGLAVACGSTTRTVTDDPLPDSGLPNFQDGGGDLSCKGGKMCVGNAIHTCDASNKPGEKIGECNGKTEVCIGGECQGGCAAADVLTSNVGCEFWAVDLDQENDRSRTTPRAPRGASSSRTRVTRPRRCSSSRTTAAPGRPRTSSS
jgi:hypothetical protein